MFIFILNPFKRFVWIAPMGKGKKKGQVQDDWENEMEEIAQEATGLDLNKNSFCSI